MNMLCLLAANTPVTPDSEGHDLTWPYWVAFLIAALLVVVIPFLSGWNTHSERRAVKKFKKWRNRPVL